MDTKTSGSRDTLTKSTISLRGSDTMLVSDVTAERRDSFGGVADTLNSLAESLTICSTPDDVRIEFCPWRLSHSQFRYRGTPNVIDLGEIS
jgi:hypothetical protein